MALDAIDPGRLRTQFRLETNSPVPDGHGGHADQWTLVTLVWGQVEKIRADDPQRAATGEQVTDVTILLRADPRIGPEMRLVDGSRIHLVRTVHDPDGTGRYLRCLATEEPVQ